MAEAGISTTLIADAAVFAIMARVNKVIVGAHCVIANGGLIAAAGSRLSFSQRASLGNPHYRIQHDWRASGRGPRQSLLRDRAHRTR